MRNRLIELIGKELLDYASWSTEMALAGNYNMPSVEEVIADKILADGWMRPPVKIGQELWDIHYNRPRKWEVVYLGYNGKEWFINVWWYKDRHNFKTMQITYPFLGKMWYFTKEEAEQALKGGV